MYCGYSNICWGVNEKMRAEPIEFISIHLVTSIDLIFNTGHIHLVSDSHDYSLPSFCSVLVQAFIFVILWLFNTSSWFLLVSVCLNFSSSLQYSWSSFKMKSGHVTTVSSPPISPIPSKWCIRLQLWPMPGHWNGGINSYYYFGNIQWYPLRCKP